MLLDVACRLRCRWLEHSATFGLDFSLLRGRETTVCPLPCCRIRLGDSRIPLEGQLWEGVGLANPFGLARPHALHASRHVNVDLDPHSLLRALARGRTPKVISYQHAFKCKQQGHEQNLLVNQLSHSMYHKFITRPEVRFQKTCLGSPTRCASVGTMNPFGFLVFAGPVFERSEWVKFRLYRATAVSGAPTKNTAQGRHRTDHFWVLWRNGRLLATVSLGILQL